VHAQPPKEHSNRRAIPTMAFLLQPGGLAGSECHWARQNQPLMELRGSGAQGSDRVLSSLKTWSEPIGCRISEATRFCISPAPAATSGASKKAERAFMQLAHFSQPETEAPSSTGAPLTIETR